MEPSPSTATPSHALRLEGWAVLLCLWLTFGAVTVLTSLALQQIADPVRLPETMREAVWLVLGIWITAYLVGAVIGFLHADQASRRRIMGSTILGFLIALGLHLMFLNTFPGTPRDGFGVFLDIVNLRPLPTYYAFILLTLVIGPGIVALSTFTGLLLAQEFRSYLPPLQIEGRIVLFNALAPLSLIIFVLGALNQRNDGRILEIFLEARQTDTVLEPVILLDLDHFINPTIHMIIAAIFGIGIGLLHIARSRTTAALNTMLGLGIHVTLVIIFAMLLAPHGPTQDFANHLGSLQAPDVLFFVALWFGPPLVGAGAAFAFHNLRDVLFSGNQRYAVNAEPSNSSR